MENQSQDKRSDFAGTQVKVEPNLSGHIEICKSIINQMREQLNRIDASHERFKHREDTPIAKVNPPTENINLLIKLNNQESELRDMLNYIIKITEHIESIM